MKQRKTRAKGFTLVELMTVIIVIALLATWAVPTFNEAKLNYQLNSAHNRVVSSVNWARSQAIRSQNFVVLAPTTAGQWQGGWKVFMDKDNNGVFSSGDEELRIEAGFPSTLVATGGSVPIKINPSGIITSGEVTVTQLTNGIRTRRILVTMNRVDVCDPVSATVYPNASIRSCSS